MQDPPVGSLGTTSQGEDEDWSDIIGGLGGSDLGRQQYQTPARSGSTDSPTALPKEEKAGETVRGGKRRDPRDNTKLFKVLIPNPVQGGTDVWIDINPKTGGIFLDRGELSILSGMPDVVTILRTAIKTAHAFASRL